MPFFDFHCHPSLKTLFTHPADEVTPWQNIEATIDLSVIKDIGINELFNELLNSQSSLTQLANEVKLFGIALHAPEANMAVGLAAQPLVKMGLIKQIDSSRVNYIAEGTHSYELINFEITKLIQSQSANNYRLIILRNNVGYNEASPDTLYAFLMVEGLHCFLNDSSTSDVKHQFDTNFDAFTDMYKIVAVNLCHLQQNIFCNHAHGIQVFNDALFYPTGNGITELGYYAIDTIIRKKILIDIKHTSLRSRRQLYAHLKNEDGKYRTPIICTHAGVTGLSIKDRVKYLLRKPEKRDVVYRIEYCKPQSRVLSDTYFNCCSINLYDEDIVEILNSDGLIGLSLDQRILGFANENVLSGVTLPSDVEYISLGEADFFLGPAPQLLPVYHSNEGIWTTEDYENYDPSLNEILHFRFFFNNVIHILRVAVNNGIDIHKAAKQICIGSDFDGLINAIDNCKNATEFGLFKEKAYKNLSALFSEAQLDHFGIDVPAFIEDLFYTNGKTFILDRLKG